MVYVLINGVAIVLGGALAQLVRRYISKAQIEATMIIINVTIMTIGIKGAITTQNPVLMLASVGLGGLVGVGLDIDSRFHAFGDWLKKTIGSSDPVFAKGVVTVFMMQAIGAMAIIGPVNAALHKDGSILILKSVLDFASSLIYGSVFGWGVMLSGPLVTLYQGIIFLLASFIAPFLTPEMTGEISAIGSLLIFALSLSLLEIKEIKVANYLPAMLGPVVYLLLQNLLHFG